MKPTILPLAVILVCGAMGPSTAQQDSSYLNAGYLSFRKEFTQHVSIKGADLEKMPFTNLGDAISAWLYGAFAQPSGLIYIVDGNTVSDVNAYSVFDVEEVILVENAAALATTAAGQQEVVLIRTRRWKGKSGVMAAAQSGVVNVSGYHPTARWSQNFYAGGYRNWDKVSIGVSANYLRDVFPDTLSGHEGVTPQQLGRWRLNAYFDWRFNQWNVVEVAMGYTPQQAKEGWDSVTGPSDNRLKTSATQRLVVPHLSWRSDIASGLKNEFQATYLHEGGTGRGYTSYFNGGTFGDGFYSTYSRSTTYHLLIWDRLEYRGKIGRVDVTPSVNASYEYSRDRDSSSFFSGSEQSSGGLGTNQVYSAGYDIFRSNSKFLFLSPAVDLSYKRAFDLQAGVLVEAGHQHGPGNRQGFPFVSLMLDPLRMAKENRESSLRLFGSYAQRTGSTVMDYMLTDVGQVSASSAAALTTGLPVNAIGGVNTGTYGYGGPFKPPVYWVGEAGVAYSFWKDRVLAQYTFERRNYSTGVYILGASGINGAASYLIFPEVRSSMHRVDVRVMILDGVGLRWISGINMTMLRNNVDGNLAQYYEIAAIGDVAPSGWSQTGGWVNRIRIKRVTAGVDVLYHFGETEMRQPPYSWMIQRGGKRNSVLVPNIYAGYDWKLRGAGALELFLESRGAIRNSPNNLSDGRRYYTFGGKLSM
jgi:hypothetical protein